ncbi:MAG TPA: hypothetical protein VG095_03350, partial [Chthoniobacterales bacterium]|nr:hypothetical protein [Chthoniobacterales bacterium]
MSEVQETKVKRSLWETIKAGSGPYRRLFAYVKPYKGRFALGLAFGAIYGVVNGTLPLVLGQVMNAVFGGMVNTSGLWEQREQLNT